MRIVIGGLPCAGGDWISGLQEWAQTMDSRKTCAWSNELLAFNAGARARRCLQPRCRRHDAGAGPCEAGQPATGGTMPLSPARERPCRPFVFATSPLTHCPRRRPPSTRWRDRALSGSAQRKGSWKVPQCARAFTTAEEVRRP